MRGKSEKIERIHFAENLSISCWKTEKKVLSLISRLGKEETLIILLSAWDRSRDSKAKRNLSKHMLWAYDIGTQNDLDQKLEEIVCSIGFNTSVMPAEVVQLVRTLILGLEIISISQMYLLFFRKRRSSWKPKKFLPLQSVLPRSLWRCFGWSYLEWRCRFVCEDFYLHISKNV